MKKLLIMLTVLGAGNLFASQDLPHQILNAKLEIPGSYAFMLAETDSEKNELRERKIQTTAKLNQLCGALHENLRNKNFESVGDSIEFAARTLEDDCEMELPEGYRWKIQID